MGAVTPKTDQNSQTSLQRWYLWAPLVCIAATLLVIAYPPVGMGGAAYVALVPFFFALQMASNRRQAVVRGVAMAFLLTCGLFYFALFISLATWPERIGSFLAIFSILTLQYAIFACGAWTLLPYKGNREPATHILRQIGWSLALALLWWASEWITQRLCFGLAAYLGLTQWRYPAIVRLARFIGLSGVSAVVAAANAAVWLAVKAIAEIVRANARSVRIKHNQPGKIAHTDLRRWPGVAAMILTLLALAFAAQQGALKPAGVWPTIAGSGAPADQGDMELVLVQNGFTLAEYQDAEYDSAALRQLFARLLVQSRKGAVAGWQELAQVAADTSADKLSTAAHGGNGAVVVLWPETVLHSPVMNYPDYAAEMQQMTRDTGVWLVAGLPWLDGEQSYNSAILLDPKGELAGIYSKMRPIPIAESWVTPGAGWQPLHVDGKSVGIGLCSELIDPLPAKVLTKNGATVLAFLSSLDHLGRSSAAGLQGAFAPFRAAETGRYLAQVGSVGLTLVATPAGVVIKVLPSRTAGVLTQRVPQRTDTTPYIQYGDVQTGIAIAGSILLQLLALRRRGVSNRQNRKVRV